MLSLHREEHSTPSISGSADWDWHHVIFHAHENSQEELDLLKRRKMTCIVSCISRMSLLLKIFQSKRPSFINSGFTYPSILMGVKSFYQIYCSFLLISILFYFHSCLCTCGNRCIHVYSVVHRDQICCVHLELELEQIVCCLIWVKGTRLCYFERAANTLRC